MHNHYRDILERIAEPPSWFDENGVPRYGAFDPQGIANIYAREAALLEVSCQFCGRRFRVALTESFADRERSLSDDIRLGDVRYGDPPNMGCCEGGPMASSDPRAVLEYWSRDDETGLDWVRHQRFEGAVPTPGFVPVDAVTDVLAAVEAGARKVLVLCTSHRNRFDIVRRVTAAMAARGRVLLAEDDRRLSLSHRLFEGLMPAARFGFIDASGRDNGRDVTIARFGQLDTAKLGGTASIVVMSGPNRTACGHETASHALDRLAAEFDGAPRIELALAHSCYLADHPDAVVDASRMTPPEA